MGCLILLSCLESLSREPAFRSGKALSPFLIGRMFVREPSLEYSANLVGS